ncbi:MAG: ATP-dependent Clp protease proteolytic subunit [Eubacteriales bacterium]|nr:ATP-dependent Clp protease proteolytic subunit [Eubacteriales bacterium]
MLNEVKESILNAYEIRTGMSRAKLSHLMDSETWMNAGKAIEYGFVDDVLTDEKRESFTPAAFAFSAKETETHLWNRLEAYYQVPVKKEPEVPMGTPIDELTKRLNLIKP